MHFYHTFLVELFYIDFEYILPNFIDIFRI